MTKDELKYIKKPPTGSKPEDWGIDDHVEDITLIVQADIAYQATIANELRAEGNGLLTQILSALNDCLIANNIIPYPKKTDAIGEEEKL